jgi:hypothetical protein
MEGMEIGMTGALEVAKEEVDDLGPDVETSELCAELLDTRLDLLIDIVNGLDEVLTATLEVLDGVFDEVLDEILYEDLDDALLATFEELDDVVAEILDEVFVEVFDTDFEDNFGVELTEPTCEVLLFVELDDNFVNDFVDEVFEEVLVETFVVEAVTFLDDVLLVGVEMALPSTHVHSLTKSLAEYLMNGDVVLGLVPCQ